jgi:hypothetical protein
MDVEGRESKVEGGHKLTEAKGGAGQESGQRRRTGIAAKERFFAFTM